MSKYTYKQIKEIQEFTPKELKNKQIADFEYEKRLKIGYYRKYNANWNYEVFVVEYNQRLIEVVSVFGSII